MGGFFSHPQAGRNNTEFWTLPLLKSALQTHEGPTETPKGHSVHGRKALEQWKPISETEGMNHCSLSANNQPINEWINRSINQSTKHRRIDRSVNQSIDESCQPILIAEQITVYNRVENTWQTEHKSSKPSIRSSKIPCTIHQVSIQVSLWVKEKRKQQNNTIDITTRIQCIASVQIKKKKHKWK